jgi:transposase-like protein
MGRKPRVNRTPEEKWGIVQEGIKSGNISETCRWYGIAPNLFYRWKDEAEPGAKAALGGEKRCRGGNGEGSAHPATGADAGAEVVGDRILKNVVGE